MPITNERLRALLRPAAIAAVALLTAGAGVAGAQSTTGGASPDERPAAAPAKASSSTVAAVQRALGIPADGVAGPQTRRALRRFQRAHGLRADGVIGRRTLVALGIAEQASVRSTAGAGASAQLERIAQCESGGNPAAISPDGRYRGKYQFSRATWRSLGGSGDPAAAPESVQDRLAAKLLASQGPSAWPNCAG